MANASVTHEGRWKTLVVEGWLVRGAESVHFHLDEAEARAKAKGWNGAIIPVYSLREQAPPAPHKYEPNRKYPWFCKHCGYPEHEALKHIQPENDHA